VTPDEEVRYMYDCLKSIWGFEEGKALNSEPYLFKKGFFGLFEITQKQPQTSAEWLSMGVLGKRPLQLTWATGDGKAWILHINETAKLYALLDLMGVQRADLLLVQPPS